MNRCILASFNGTKDLKIVDVHVCLDDRPGGGGRCFLEAECLSLVDSNHVIPLLQIICKYRIFHSRSIPQNDVIVIFCAKEVVLQRS